MAKKWRSFGALFNVVEASVDVSLVSWRQCKENKIPNNYVHSINKETPDVSQFVCLILADTTNIVFIFVSYIPER
jgi:hypothetical protein